VSGFIFQPNLQNWEIALLEFIFDSAMLLVNLAQFSSRYFLKAPVPQLLSGKRVLAVLAPTPLILSLELEPECTPVVCQIFDLWI
jgi:hypothetical protein